MKVKKLSHGFTLIEVLIVMSLIAIAVTVSVPSYFGLVMDNRIASASNAMMTAIATARSNAISLKSSVAILPIDNDWSNGWQVVVEENNHLLATFPVHETLKVSSINAKDLVFNPVGTKSTLAKMVVNICADTGQGREITITGVGATRTKALEDNCKT